MAFRHPTIAPGRCHKTCTPLVCWLVLISYIFCYLPRGAGVNPGQEPTGVRVLGRFAPLETLREVCPMYLGLTGGTLAPTTIKKRAFAI